MPAPSDDDLVAGIRTGSGEMVAAFYERFRPRLLSLAWHRDLPISEVEDLVEETLLAAITQIKAGKFESRSKVGTWVYSIFNGRVEDLFRRNARRNRRLVPLDEAVSSGKAPVKTHDPLACGPDQEVRLAVHQALAAMPARERLVLLMNKQDGWPAREISRLLGLNRKTTEGILTAAKKRFKQLVMKGQENLPGERLRIKEGP